LFEPPIYILFSFKFNNIFENPCPNLAILSFGSLNGSFFHTVKSFYYPNKFTTFFSHEAQDTGPRCFLLNIASSSCNGFFYSISIISFILNDIYVNFFTNSSLVVKLLNIYWIISLNFSFNLFSKPISSYLSLLSDNTLFILSKFYNVRLRKLFKSVIKF
jgi:hypothetical protein